MTEPKQFEKWEDVPEEIKLMSIDEDRCAIVNATLRWAAEQQPEPAGEPKLPDHWDDIPLRAREKVNRLCFFQSYTESQVELFKEGILNGWRQAMEKQAEKIPFERNPKLKKEWIDSLAGNIIGHDEHPGRMKFEDLAGLIEEHVDKLGVPVLNLTVSPKVEKEIDWEQESKMTLTFDDLRAANKARLPLFKNRKGEPAHSEPDGSDWCLAQWCNAVTGELGEAANLIKKIERGDMTLAEARQDLADELADVQTYLDILAFRAGINLGHATICKFNKVSARVGCNVEL